MSFDAKRPNMTYDEAIDAWIPVRKVPSIPKIINPWTLKVKSPQHSEKSDISTDPIRTKQRTVREEEIEKVKRDQTRKRIKLR